jgi:hypothetical protein
MILVFPIPYKHALSIFDPHIDHCGYMSARHVSSDIHLIFVVYRFGKFKFWSEWLLFNANSAIFQLYHGENKVIFNEIMRSALYFTNMP